MDIIISPIHQTFFIGQGWFGLDLEKIAAILSDTYGHRVTTINFADVASDYGLIPQGACWFYSLSNDERYNRHIRDVILDFDRSRKDVVLIPKLDLVFSFENKGYQELYKRRLGIERVRGRYFGDQDEFVPGEAFDYPFVFKKINGSGSNRVWLIKTRKELDSLLKKDSRQTFFEKIPFYERLIKHKMKKKRFAQWIIKQRKRSVSLSNELNAVNLVRYYTKRSPFVIQEFISGLDHDYRVLIFGEKFYVVKRRTRPNDFRASGGGRNELIVPPLDLLDFAEVIYKKMNVPFCSLDIGEMADGYALFEYQGLGFSPLGLTGSSFYYTKTESGWTKTEATPNLEEEYARAIHYFLTKVRVAQNIV